ncbi:MAG TPA: TldD/PmbA family protein [Clostridia bacterium]|jgi:TldD protein|nr:MAG: protease TldD [Firmicutes bacterium ADurb.Bin146]HOD92958.1 TldD/PmbA family protein [Clostridia bacterium]HQM39270.1 TldD/PmbA family protein [Clostridia bacterium]
MLDKNTIYDVLTAAVSKGADFAEIFLDDTVASSINYVDRQVESTQSGRDFGIGIRVIKDLNCVYVYTNSFIKEEMIKTALKAAAAMESAKKDISINLVKSDVNNRNIIKIMPDTVEKKEKLEYLKRAYETVISYDQCIRQASIMQMDKIQNILIANTEGLLKQDKRVYTRFYISAVAEHNNEMQTGFSGPGAHKGFEFIKSLDIENISRNTAETAKKMAYAGYCKAGSYPVVIDNGFGGVIFHEACGHSLEATSVAKGNSVFSGKLGQKIAADCVTAIDDGTLLNEWGSLNIDDEGTPTRKNILIENGILKSYLVDTLNGKKMGMVSTGSSRRQNYRFAPTSRMTNTYIDNGKNKKEDIISSTDYGLYAKQMGGGSVNPGTGEFNFAVVEGYMIRNGKISEPVRGATLIGKGSEILMNIDMVADNLACAQGMCGSISGSIPTNVGQPALRVSKITVGGR